MENELQNQPERSKSILYSTKFKIALVLVVLLIVTIIPIIFVSQNIIAYNTVEYISTAPITAEGQITGVQGKLVPNSYVQSPDGLSATFSLTDEDSDHTVSVLYSGEIGQLFFNEYSTIIVDGYKPSEDNFVATRLTVRCPSKYQVEDEIIESVSASS